MEAQRLGIEAHGSDLNPVAVLITKALIEIPPKFKDKPPVNPEARKTKDINQWRGAQGLAEDVRYYGQWMRDEAEKRIGHLYPKVELPEEHGGGEATVIAWLWARTVKCPNPACGCQMPLVRSFQLSKKKGKEAWVEPIIDRSQNPPVTIFEVKTGKGKPIEGTTSRKGAVCLACATPTNLDYVRNEGQEGRMDAQLMAIVAEGDRGRIYLSPNDEHEKIAVSAQPEWKPETELIGKAAANVSLYGLKTHSTLFTSRQLVVLNTFSDLVNEVRENIKQNAISIGMPNDNLSLSQGGVGITAYADAIATYLAFTIDRCTDYWSAICSWNAVGEKMRNTFGRQAIPMVWDYAECYPFSNSSGNFEGALNWVTKVVANSSCNAQGMALLHKSKSTKIIPS